MPFRIWYYLVKVVAPLLFVGVIFGVALPGNPIASAAYRPSLVLLIVLGVMGGILGMFLALGRLRMRCPFCGRYGPVGGNKVDGLWLECDGCGTVRGAGPFGLRLSRQASKHIDVKQGPVE